MSIRSNISKPARARIFLLLGAGLIGLAVAPAPGRPIEFSDPASSNLTANVSSLGAKPAELPGMEDRVFKPHSYNSDRAMSYGMRPVSTRPPPANNRNNTLSGAFDLNPNWNQLTPDKILLEQGERDAFKLPAFGSGNNSATAWTAWDPYNLKSARRDGNSRGESRGGLRETNRFNSNDTFMNAADPFAAYSGRRSPFDDATGSGWDAGAARGASDPSRDAVDLSAEALAQKQQADRLEEFRRTLSGPTPVVNPLMTAPAIQPARNNAYVSEVDNFSRARLANPLLAIPVAPLAPQAPLAPGQTSLTPSPYTSPAKLKPVVVTAPRRSF